MLCIFVTSKPQNKPALKSLQNEFMQAIWSYYYVATIELNHFVFHIVLRGGLIFKKKDIEFFLKFKGCLHIQGFA